MIKYIKNKSHKDLSIIAVMPLMQLTVILMTVTHFGAVVLPKGAVSFIFHCIILNILTVDGRYSLWSSWSACSRSCDGGIKYRSRSCTNPPPTKGGRDCWRLGTPVESQTCDTDKCPVHGGYSHWSSWSRCSRSCAGGTQRRFRSCTNPFPANGGRDCSGQGEAMELRKCNNHDCPDPPRAQLVSPISKVLDASVGSSASFTCNASGTPLPRIRWMRQSGSSVNEIGVDNVKYEVISRSGSSQLTIKDISVDDQGYYICNASSYKYHLERVFLGVISLYIPIHGGYSQWSYWSYCSKRCGEGTQQRTRSCTNPPPASNGRHCSGPDKVTRRCNTHRCPVHGRYSHWSFWSQCSQSCEGGTQHRFRSCTNPPPALGGRGCLTMRRARESRRCNTQKCPVIHTAFCRNIAGDEACADYKGNCTTAEVQIICAKACGKCHGLLCRNSEDDAYCSKYSKHCSSSNPAFSQLCKKTCGLCRV